MGPAVEKGYRLTVYLWGILKGVAGQQSELQNVSSSSILKTQAQNPTANLNN